MKTYWLESNLQENQDMILHPTSLYTVCLFVVWGGLSLAHLCICTYRLDNSPQETMLHSKPPSQP